MSSLDSLISIYIDVIAKLIRGLSVAVGSSGLTITFEAEAEAQQSLDERIIKLDAAKQNLADGIRAIDQLKDEAERSKTEVAAAALQIEQLSKDKDSLAARLDAMQSVLKADVEAFRHVAGVPTESTIRRERIIGFVSGVAASIVAAILSWAAIGLYKHFFP